MYNVLIADDDEIICEGLRRTADWASVDARVVDVAFDGEEALRKIGEHHVDIVILDINMPFVNGVELASILSEKYPGLIMIMLTAYKDFSYAQKAIKCRVFDYLTKPCHNDEVIDAVQRAVSQIGGAREKDRDEKLAAEGDHVSLTLQIVRYIRSHYDDPELNLKKVADAMHISTSYLQLLLKKREQTSFSEILNKIRMEKAMSLLRKNEARVYEVAFMVGFNSSQYFSRKFKKYYGIEPRDVRKNGS